MIKNFSRYYRTLRHLKFIQIWNRIVRKIMPVTVQQADLNSSIALRSNWFYCNSPEIFDGENFTFLNKTITFKGADDWNHCTDDKLWLYNLHYFDFLKQCEFRKKTCSNAIIERWIDENPVGVGNGWEPYTLSLRIVNWIKWIWHGNELSGTMRHSLVLQCRALYKQLEYHLLANHLMTNGKALIFAGMFFRGKESQKWLRKGWEIYSKEIKEEILADGGHFERTLMYHSIILEDLLDVYQATGKKELRTPIEKMLHFLAEMLHPDRQIVLFNDAAFGIAPEPDALFDYAERLGFQISRNGSTGFLDFPETGYSKASWGDWNLFMDTYGIAPSYQPGHSHADTFSFELSFKGKRIIGDSGTSSYQGKERAYQRSTAAHNTVVVDGKNSSEVWGAHRVGSRAEIFKRTKLESGFAASHNGFRNVIHERRWFWQKDSLQIVDILSGKGKHKIELFFHFMPDEIVSLYEENQLQTSSGLLITLPQGGKTEVLNTEMGIEFGLLKPQQTVKWTIANSLPLTLSTNITLK